MLHLLIINSINQPIIKCTKKKMMITNSHCDVFKVLFCPDKETSCLTDYYINLFNVVVDVQNMRFGIKLMTKAIINHIKIYLVR